MESRDRLFAAGGAVALAMLGTAATAGFAGAQTGPETAAMQALVAKAPSCIARPRVVTVAPGQSIQAAIDRAEPGTVISVEAGTYRGSLDLTGLRGTPDRPVILLSAGGVGAAVIVGAPDKPAIGAWGISDVGIYGFKVVSGTSAGDLGGFKIAGPWEKPARNVAIVGNVVTGVGTDGIKLFNGAADIKVVGNLIDGDWREEGMDNVSVERSLFAFNTVRGSARYTSITMKAGSRDITLAGNEFDSRSGVGINVGGVGTSRFNRKFPDYWKGFEASAITVTGNVVGDRPERSVAFIGANRSVLKDNFLAGAVRSRRHEQPGKLLYPSHDNQILGNTVAKESFFEPDDGQDRGYVLAGNATGAPKVRAGVTALPGPVRAVCPASPAGTLARTFTSSE
ncbi:hypothetical protein JL101_031340 (plasmid) [Skermanella rosea]|uniref:right-handed parallel beta-helix repeat-containing protein n=1 Tax=Skermanella rosea TaxID=1817965 RepID=UPI001932BADA|nr:hypothetical protein [Skermanella rosea]UEM06975.1 hypothetical protein JL101_031340 [Skermanella rosea]